MTNQQLALRDDKSEALVPESQDSAILVMFERLATNPQVNPESLKALLDVRERMLDREAEGAFNAAFIAMRPKLPTIVERKQGDKWKYAPREDIVEIVTPILHEFHFSLSHETDWTPDGSQAIVVALLTHVQGHTRRSKFMSPADNSGSKNAVQGRGSAIEYGKRYTTEDVLGLVTRDMDTNGALPKQAPPGFDEWALDLELVADEGTKALRDAWQKSKPEFREHLASLKGKSDALKMRAKKADEKK